MGEKSGLPKDGIIAFHFAVNRDKAQYLFLPESTLLKPGGFCC
jgi:hypothetical protein